MKKLSLWSTRNPIKARMIIAVCHLVLIGTGIFLGVFTYLEDVKISKGFLFLMVVVFSLAYLFYPSRGETKGLFKYTWSRRVKHDFAMCFTYACMLVAGINQFAYTPLAQEVPEPQVRLMVAKSGSMPDVNSKKEVRVGLKMQIRAYKSNIKQQFKALKAEWKAQDDKLVPLKIILILSVLVLAAGAGYGIALLSCELSCNGQEGAAIAVAVLGTLSIVLLSVIAIRAIVRMGKTPIKPPAEKPIKTQV